MAILYYTRASSALSTANDTLTIVGAANRTIRVKRIIIGGLGTSSASNVAIVMRSSGGTTGGGALTPAPAVTGAAAGCAVYTTWSAQPTPGVVFDRVPVNANGGVAIIYYPPGQEPELRGTEMLSVRSETGTSNISISIVIDEQ